MAILSVSKAVCTAKECSEECWKLFQKAPIARQNQSRSGQLSSHSTLNAACANLFYYSCTMHLKTKSFSTSSLRSRIQGTLALEPSLLFTSHFSALSGRNPNPNAYKSSLITRRNTVYNESTSKIVKQGWNRHLADTARPKLRY